MGSAPFISAFSAGRKCFDNVSALIRKGAFIFRDVTFIFVGFLPPEPRPPGAPPP